MSAGYSSVIRKAKASNISKEREKKKPRRKVKDGVTEEAEEASPTAAITVVRTPEAELMVSGSYLDSKMADVPQGVGQGEQEEEQKEENGGERCTRGGKQGGGKGSWGGYISPCLLLQ